MVGVEREKHLVATFLPYHPGLIGIRNTRIGRLRMAGDPAAVQPDLHRSIRAKQELTRIAPLVYEIPVTQRQDMRVPARIYADDDLLEMALGDRSVEQLVNTATLPGIVSYALAMPDVHQGYGFPIGGVAATLLPEGIISPGGVGYDINCGVRLLTTTLEAEALRPHLDRLMNTLFKNVATGVGAGGGLRLDRSPGATVTGNIFDRSGGPGVCCDSGSMDGLWSDANAFAPTGQPIAAAAKGAVRVLWSSSCTATSRPCACRKARTHCTELMLISWP